MYQWKAVSLVASLLGERPEALHCRQRPVAFCVEMKQLAHEADIYLVPSSSLSGAVPLLYHAPSQPLQGQIYFQLALKNCTKIYIK
jgi:hypothetical protein